NSSTTDPSTTDTTLGAKIETTYATYISSSQPADTYTGQVKYTMVHPYDRYAPEAPYFQVFYTGRPVSTTPGEENPVKIRMSDLPADGKYNLLGTADGLYDKLTPGRLYGGYYKNIVSRFDDFSYSNDATTYNGANFDWSVKNPETADAAEIIPENEATYYVKEVPNGYLQNYYHMLYYTSSGRLTYIYVFSAFDDLQYDDIGFEINGIEKGASWNYTFTFTSSTHVTVISPSDTFGDKGVLGGAVMYGHFDELITVGNHTVLPYWITMDNYKVTGKTLRTINVVEPLNTAVTYTETDIVPKIEKKE
ncbi:hypothetical protein IJI28_02310, partial [Candidatus Saccharibacteria bacterium]|nr:hypothetical protein [Candidatus Saccharibacteria bacterium]